MIKTNLLSNKAGMSYFEIAIIIISVFAFSYIIYSLSEEKETPVTETIPVSSKSTTFAHNLANFIFSTGIGSVSALEVTGDSVCCEKKLNGEFCENSTKENCDPKFQIYPKASCDQVTIGNCQLGCCQSSDVGTCNPRTPKAKCTALNGTFKPEILCSIPECREGCCYFGNNVKWVTEKNCKFLGNSQNPTLKTNWVRDEKMNSEIKCQYSLEKDKEGACVYLSEKERKCIYTTFDDCISRTKNESSFDQKQRFCSAPELNTTCKAHDHKSCIEGKEDVFWFDSCGNHEEIAKDCNLFQGNYCGKKGNDYICKDINCVVDGQQRKNGESWCEYDNVIGNGKDPAGSRHVRHLCYMGTERIEPCEDYRNQICVETTSQTKEGGFAQAACRVNNWRRCLELNSKKNVDEMKNKCQQNPDCVLKHIDMGGSFNFWVCSNAYPPGFTFDDFTDTSKSESTYSSGDSICSIATQRCTETWICGIFGCICVDNCKCHTAAFTKDMNDLCISLGDCGAYINYVGTYTDGGYSVKGAPRVDMKFLASQGGEKPAKPGNFEFFETLNPENLKDLSTYEDFLNSSNENKSSFQKEIDTVTGAMGSPLLLYILSKDNANNSLEEDEANNLASSPVNMVGYFNGYSSVRSSISAQIVQKDRKAGGFEMIAAMIAGLIAYIIFQSILIAFLAAMLAFLFAMAWIMYVYIDFTCGMWERPSGGDECNKCNTGDTPCSEYRCQSLGELCRFENKGTPNELCLSRPANTTLPTIQPFYDVITKGYKYDNVQDNGFEIRKEDGSCIDAFTSVNMGIKVSPFAKCRLSTDPKQKWEEMTVKFGLKGESILPAHQMGVFLPSPEAVKNSFAGRMVCNKTGKLLPCNLTDEQIQELTKVEMFIKCKTADGKVNPEPYSLKTCVYPGPDLTAPKIAFITPGMGSYVQYGKESQDVLLFINEPSECRWSHEDSSFDLMKNKFDCKTNIEIDYQSDGLPCNATLTFENNNTKFYVKCQDLSENKNTMTKSFEYELEPSESALSIIDMIPTYGETRIFGGQPATITLRLETAGGAENGVSKCEWSEPKRTGYLDYFTETDSTKHSYEWNFARNGEWNLSFKCEDAGGNIAENSTFFKVIIDTSGPKIVRVFNEGGLRITTDEKAQCRYSSKRNFNFENATEMDRDYTLEHFGIWGGYGIYYVQCKDEYGNPGPKLMASPYEAFSK
jgi:hypothetical protein